MKRVCFPVFLTAPLFALAAACQAQTGSAGEISLRVDLSDAPRKMIHAAETLPVAPGQLTLLFPEWIPGEHGPTGPIGDMAGLMIFGRTAAGQPCATAAPPRPSPLPGVPPGVDPGAPPRGASEGQRNPQALGSQRLPDGNEGKEPSDPSGTGPFAAPGLDSGGSSAGRIEWQRDPVNMYAFHVAVPSGCSSLRISIDFLATAAPTGFSAGASTSENLALLSWNTVVVSPAGVSPAELRIRPSLILPGGWRYGTALRASPSASGGAETENGPGGMNSPAAAGSYTVAFEPVTLERLIDSPVLAGRYFREIPLAADVNPKHYLDMAADGPEQLALTPDHIAQLSRMVQETGALFASHHYTSYHFLVTISDSVAHFGLEHHQSSDDRIPQRTFIEDDRFTLDGDLLPHEFTHSWNGKYRRPAGLATGNYTTPMVGDQLWVYEGLTQYLAGVLATRSGIWTEEDYLGQLALDAATLDHWPGRTWRNLEDTARSAQILYDADPGWENWRRGTDFYEEGELLWLEVDATLRNLSGGKKSLNDFAAAFFGVGGNTGPAVVPYTFEQLVSALNEVVPYNWAGFFRERLDTNRARAPLGGLAEAGYRLTYTPNQTVWGTMQDTQDGTVNFWFSLGLRLNGQDSVADVLRGSPADAAGLGPGMHMVAVNGRAYTPWLLRTAIHDAVGPGAAISLIVSNGEYFRTVTIPYHGGELYPTLERIPGAPDRLGDILRPMVR